ncbi:MAG: NAD(P)/FAD-dependent oxidoreductase [Streptosporangiales bacterium]|nr:NAD(P)/FAD-dependent oxidoreductase [Streptosporangiales bacterium]
MTETATEAAATDAAGIFTHWLTRFAAAVRDGSAEDLAGLLDPEATWRDFMAFPWDFHHTVGRDETVARFLELSKTQDASGFTVSQEQAPFAAGTRINGFFDFTTRDRTDRGYVALVPDGDRFIASVLQTQVTGLLDHPERTRHNRDEGKVYGVVPGRTRWSADRGQEAAFADRDPAVLILGAGHNGLSIAARLRALDVPALVIDREERVGDTWRNRYASLALHSTTYGDHLPYLPLPPTWTAHTPKDKFADLLESYATLMDLNVWTSTTFLKGHYDEAERRWVIQVRRGDGSVRTLRPRHFVVAGGLYGVPKIPQLKGMETFTGVAAHSDEFQDGDAYEGKRALVIGAGVSGHELAHDLCEHGADVTMLQRSSTYVITYGTYHKCFSTLFTEDMPYSADIGDQMAYALPPERSDENSKALTRQAAEADKDLLDQLQARGFKINMGPDGGGILAAINNGMDSYQIDIGASQLIADGEIGLKQGTEVAEIAGGTVTFTDGSALTDVDLIIFATGYHQFWGHIKPALGSVGDLFDKVYGRAGDGEYANTWRRSAHPGIWFGTGFIRMARYYTQFMALLIKAIEEGIEPYDPRDRAAG